MIEKKEYIVCAAIYHLNENTYSHQPQNIEKGIVVCGLRHSSCYGTLKHSNLPHTGVKVQGFLTSHNRFVSREEASKIAYEAGQIKKKKNALFSEDLY